MYKIKIYLVCRDNILSKQDVTYSKTDKTYSVIDKIYRGGLQKIM